MRRITFTLLALAVGLFLTAGDPKDDTERLQGTWVMVSLEIEGAEAPREQVATARLVIEGNNYRPLLDGRSYPQTFTLDPDQTPKAIDFTFTDGPRKGETVKGIYKFEEDQCVMCRAIRADDERPKEFATGAESGRAMVVWKRDRTSEDAKR